VALDAVGRCVSVIVIPVMRGSFRRHRLDARLIDIMQTSR
jgi:hypothetical protein